MELPQFKYSPNAYELNLFEETEGICSILYLEELKEDIHEISNNNPEMINYLTKDDSFVGYLFQCTKCGKHRLHADCD